MTIYIDWSHNRNLKKISNMSLHEKCRLSELFWSVFPRIRIEQRRDTPYLFRVRIRVRVRVMVRVRGKYGPE